MIFHKVYISVKKGEARADAMVYLVNSCLVQLALQHPANGLAKQQQVAQMFSPL